MNPALLIPRDVAVETLVDCFVGPLTVEEQLCEVLSRYIRVSWYDVAIHPQRFVTVTMQLKPLSSRSGPMKSMATLSPRSSGVPQLC